MLIILSLPITILLRNMNFDCLLLSFILFIGCTNSNGNKQESAHKNNDTCLYTLIVLVDLDIPKTGSFGTTIIRSANCCQHILCLQSWGTETSYSLVSPNHKRFSRFFFWRKRNIRHHRIAFRYL